LLIDKNIDPYWVKLNNLFFDNNNADNIPKDYDTIFNFFISVDLPEPMLPSIEIIFTIF
jgi:hypothetical protein